MSKPSESLLTRSASQLPKPARKAGFSTFKSGGGRETDCLLDGSGFELPVPRQMGNGFEALSKTGPISYRRRSLIRAVAGFAENTPTKRSWMDSGVLALSSRPLVDSARPNHVGAAISRHKRVGRIEERDG